VSHRAILSQKKAGGKWHTEFLVIAEHLVAARCALATAGSASAAHPLCLWPFSRVLAASFADRASPAADQSPYAPGALRTRFVLVACGETTRKKFMAANALVDGDAAQD
jgi:hypothetical protein